MTVATEACYAESLYTGAETTFTPGFSALDPSHVHVSYFDITGLLVPLTYGVHFSASLDGAGAVTVTRIAFPSASSGFPVRIAIERVTPAIQGVDFDNLAQYDASVHELIADSGAMRDAENRRKIANVVQPFTVSNGAVDFRTRVVKAADPVLPEDVATKLYADTVSGSSAAGQAAISALAAATSATSASNSATSATNSAAAAAASAAILASPDYGFFVDAPSATRDYGSTW